MLVLANILDNFRGLPTHALLVHFTETFAVLGTAGGLGYALVPKFRKWLSYPMMATGAILVILGIITPSSGENLEKRVEASALLEKHTELGGQMGTILIAYGVILMVTMFVVRYRGKGGAATAEAGTPTTLDRVGGLPGESLSAFGAQPQLAAFLTALVLVGSIISGVWIFRTGEAGAKSVWDDTPTTPLVPGAGG